MKEEYYRILGWGCLLITLIIALSWGFNEKGLAGWLMDTSERYLKTRLTQISWLITFLVLGLPGLMAKRFFDGLAWDVHLKNLPPPDIRKSAKKSKYIKLDTASAAAPPPPPVKTADLPAHQDEFVLTCPGCGNFFPAKKGAVAKCPNCGEVVPIQ
jgi:hypothetical protein